MRLPLLIIVLLTLLNVSLAQDFSFTQKEKPLMVLYNPQGPALDSIAAHCLATDIERLTGNQPQVVTEVAQAKGNVIVIGNVSSPLVQTFIPEQSSIFKVLHTKWECFAHKIIDHPTNNISKAFVIAGSDARGTAYGVFSLSEKLGVSPWYWWADVPVQQQTALIIHQPEYISLPPSVKYRGIFINDEDWGLQPWAAKTFEPETGDIGPKTYAKVFELLLRLKANLIWPAMHPSTKAFFYYPQNKKVAEAYGIVIGSSHAEPMLRNNVSEWDEKTMGPFNYITNKEKVYQYWESRVKETTANDVVYTMGMRGVHDSGMEGVKTTKEAVPLLEQIIQDQRGLLQKYRGKDVTMIPQVFTAYKEVLDIYDNGLKIPDDITLVWPDDNYGYIQRLNNPVEHRRSGGAGVYYHASYWGRPHDYLWLSTTHPSLIREEMAKANETGANMLWVLNVGDIKPQEYDMSFFLDMAYSITPFLDRWYAKTHLQNWISSQFGKDQSAAITKLLWQYYQLAFERRPEFMGWSRTEPTTQTTTTEYNHFFYGDEAQQRIDRYDTLETEAKALAKTIDKKYTDAFYQLVYYPVVCASLMNKKFLYRDKAIFYAKQNRLSAPDYAALSKAAYDSIVQETEYYNTRLAGGKWNKIMSMKPRDLPVYQPPVIPANTLDSMAGWSIAPEGFITTGAMTLPGFDPLNKQTYFIDLFLNDHTPVTWSALPSQNWIHLSKNHGVLAPETGNNQTRIWVSVDWSKVPQKDTLSGTIIFKGGNKQIVLTLPARHLSIPPGFKGFIENNGFVSMNAAHYTRKTNRSFLQWTEMPYLGYTEHSLEVVPLPLQTDTDNPSTDPAGIQKNNVSVEYDFYTFTAASPTVHVFTLPTFPLNNNYSMRYAVAIDNGPLTVVDFKTVGRTEEWKQHVLSNRAEREIKGPALNKGRHTLKIYAIDPGVIFDEIRIDLGGLVKAYGTIRETKPPMD